MEHVTRKDRDLAVARQFYRRMVYAVPRSGEEADARHHLGSIHYDPPDLRGVEREDAVLERAGSGNANRFAQARSIACCLDATPLAGNQRQAIEVLQARDDDACVREGRHPIDFHEPGVPSHMVRVDVSEEDGVDLLGSDPGRCQPLQEGVREAIERLLLGTRARTSCGSSRSPRSSGWSPCRRVALGRELRSMRRSSPWNRRSCVRLKSSARAPLGAPACQYPRRRLLTLRFAGGRRLVGVLP